MTADRRVARSRRAIALRERPGLARAIPALAAAACLVGLPTCGRRTAAANGPTASLVAAGDIAECPAGRAAAQATARLADGIPGTVAVLGDEAYPAGADRDFAQCYGPTWGRLKARTRPVPGNHEYGTDGGAPYFRYFGAAAGAPGKGYYSYDAGAWHVVALNSSIDVGPGSPQAAWLARDLAAHPGRCTLAYWHTPRFSSGPHGSRARMAAFWKLLYDSGADVVLSGHDHLYERFAPMDTAGRRDPARGIRQFVAGTGGAGLYHAFGRQPNSEVLNDRTHGVLHLTLEPGGYRWRFIPILPGTFTDAGSGTCHSAAGTNAR
jgi:3',5'-cyclic AMP phosphodiesterase CpdA